MVYLLGLYIYIYILLLVFDNSSLLLYHFLNLAPWSVHWVSLFLSDDCEKKIPPDLLLSTSVLFIEFHEDAEKAFANGGVAELCACGACGDHT